MKKFILTILIIIGCQYCYANSIDEILECIANNNLELKAFLSETKMQAAEIRSSNNLEDPTIDFEYMFGMKGVGDKLNIGISQPFSWPGLYVARSKRTDENIKALEYLAASKRVEVLTQAYNACLEVICANRNIKLFEDFLINASKIEKACQLGVNKGEFSALDYNKVRIEVLNAKNNLMSAKIIRQEYLTQLQLLNGNNPLDEKLVASLQEYPDFSLQPFETYEKVICENSPTIKYLKQNAVVARVEQKVAKLESYPSFSLGAQYQAEMGDKFAGITASMSLPVFSKRHSRAKMDAAKELADIQLLNGEQSTLTNAKAIYSRLQEIAPLVNNYKTVLSDTNIKRLINKAYKGGEMNVTTYLTEINYFINAEQQYNDLQLSQHKLFAELNSMLMK